MEIQKVNFNVSYGLRLRFRFLLEAITYDGRWS